MGKTSIEWTDETLNPIRARHTETGKVGWHCTKPSGGCKHCYAEAMNKWRGTGLPFVPASKEKIEIFLDRTVLEKPLKWKTRKKIFVCDMTDLFHEDVSDEDINKVFEMMANAQWFHGHQFQVLTKRPERMKRIVEEIGAGIAEQKKGKDNGDGTRSYSLHFHFPLNNISLGVSVEDQQTADERIPLLLQTPAAVRWISAEPLLGPVNLKLFLPLTEHGRGGPIRAMGGLDWVVVGGESGPKARPCDVAWIRSIVQQCRAAGVPCFVKQLGSCVCDRNDAGFEGDEPTSWPIDTDVEDPSNEWDWQGAAIRVRLRDRKGGDPAEWPEDLRIREFPR